ncbi:Nucleolar GTP-binding protein 1 [Phytophthora fragariae]|uniref:Nucleolar GTP-binding protein 1 n=1 Tax=Phytophthora fragariae TaxID=53985 RepID=A0A6A3ERB7_9STRA|nr:Nucleolar GTP-binding protein 1 [Phytophthora fragariae]KAE8934936.1 Nucleolar GTP-binding protein 1 [Phytophthora fragariae]KAE9002935.1 Nucleolar GTP-binding protein 1 [Phytophthora fragariae]KAE9102932.1 Nucleolar GTP-binding protein 1 [Phytophthora fragariae]KAE9103100.1 Nucleolar GTP-binding protein 1 [Phytophthora fragariae]
MVVYNFKKIQTVPTANDFIDIVLTRTQRKTPTVIHPTYAISRIRAFYMRKVKFTQQTCQEKLSQIIDDFPRLDDLHPFYADLINILYDRDHYKLALGQVNTARALIDNIAKDYVRMIKYGDSLYRCKQLKRAALGRMCTLLKKQKASLEYLEEVRKHLSRLPSIDPNTRTLLVTGFPNVGKSSFMNKVTRADVDVQPYAFTTKALYVGHLDYKYLRWQVIDTPGILDHSLEDRNTIEMQAVTALAHLQASILFFMDISEQCGFTIEQQLSLFENIRPLFANKPLVLVCNKIDQMRFEALSEHHQNMINTAVTETKAKFFTMSNHSEENVMEVRNYACDELLAHRVNSKVKGNKVADVLNRLSVAMPVARDDVKREITIPASVIAARENPNSVAPRVLLKDKMNANGGAGVYSFDFKEHYKGMLGNNDWTQDAIPEIWNGKNIADFVDPEILKRLEALEQEEDEAMANNAPMDEDAAMSDLDDEQQDKLARIREKKAIMVADHRQNKNKNHSTVSRKVRAKLRTLTETKKELEALGVDTSYMKHAEAVVAKRKAGDDSRGRKREREEMDVDMEDATESTDLRVRARAKSQMRSKSKNRSASLVAPRDQSGFGTEADMATAKRANRLTQRKAAKMGRAGEADRISIPKLAKWQNSGKRGSGNTNSR